MKRKIRLTESQLNRVIKESVNMILREMVENKPSYSDWIKFLHGREPIFEIDDDIVYVDYDEQSGCICAGGVSNAGFYSDGSAEIAVQDGDFESALSELYYQLQDFYHNEWDEQD